MKILSIVLVVLVTWPALAQSQATVKGDAAAWREVEAAWQRLGALRSYRMRMVAPPDVQGADKMRMVMEFVNPNRNRMVVDIEDTMTMEVIRVGQEPPRRRVILKGEMAQVASQSPSQAPSLVNRILGGGIFGFISAAMDPIGFVTNMVVGAVTQAVTQSVMSQVAPAGADIRPGVWQCQRPQTSASVSASTREVTVARAGEATIDGARTLGYDLTFVEQSGTTKMRMYVLADRQLPRRTASFDASGKLVGGMDYYDFDAPITIELPPCEQ